MRPRSLLIAVAAGLALADASVVTLALPELLVQLNTTVEGVAAVIGVYTVTLAALLIPAERLARRVGPATLGVAGFAIFALASLLCGASSSLGLLLVGRALQAAGGAAGLIAAFELLHGERTSARNLWLGAAVLSAAVGPALGGALTQAFSWRAIFYAQAPVAVLAALIARERMVDRADPAAGSAQAAAASAAPAAGAAAPGAAAAAAPGAPWRAQAALALVSAALTAVLFLLVLLLVAGWAVAPLAAAGSVTVLPAAALAGSRLGGDARWRAAGGCVLVGLGTIALAYLPDAKVYWTFAPQVLAGLGMGLALPALAGELLPERDAADAARLLTVRHVGIAVALAVLAPVTANRLDSATRDARSQGVALVLDAKIDPTQKLQMAPVLLQGVQNESPRKGLKDAIADQRPDVAADQLPAYDELSARADDILVDAVGDSFFPAFWITGAFALLGGALLLTRARMPAWLPAAAAAGIAVAVIQVVVWDGRRPERVTLADPCKPRALPATGGLGGFLQDSALQLLDRQACRIGSTREELVLALAGGDDAKSFEKKYGENPRSAEFLLGSLLGG
jgi:hypothetical protein